MLTPQVQQLAERALAFLQAGYPVNLSGPAGTGKTTMALHLAAQLDQPVTLIHGDDEFGSSDLVGNDKGYQKSRLVDNFIHSVMKTEETMRSSLGGQPTDNRLPPRSYADLRRVHPQPPRGQQCASEHPGRRLIESAQASPRG